MDTVHRRSSRRPLLDFFLVIACYLAGLLAWPLEELRAAVGFAFTAGMLLAAFELADLLSESRR